MEVAFMELKVGGIIRKLKSQQVNIMKSQVGELERSLQERRTTLDEWSNSCNDQTMKTILKISKLNYLATDMGVAFIRKKVADDASGGVTALSGGCPLAPYREH